MINKKLDEISAKLETIKALVQDNEYLSNVEKSCDEVNKRNQILENRIQKAIEYIEWNLEANEEVIEYINFDGNFKKVLDILKGNDNE